MKSIIEKKSLQVDNLKEAFLNAKTVVVLDYQGLSVEEFTKLRNELRQNDSTVSVYKNNIAKRAANAAGFVGLEDCLAGPKAICISNTDVVAPAKIVYEFSKINTKVQIVGGVIEGDVSDASAMIALASIPNRETLLTQLAAGLLQPVSQIAIGLNMLVNEEK